MVTILLLMAALSVGFGLGRIKNAAKLAAAQAELDKAKTMLTGYVATAAAEVKKVI